MSSYYVYTLAYPEEMGGSIFYIGKGSGDRINQHEKDAELAYDNCNVKKLQVIRSIKSAGYQVVKTIVLRTNDEQEALRQEQKLIALHSTILTNIQHNTHVNPLPRSPRTEIPVPTREERRDQAIARALLLNRNLAAKYPESEREGLLMIWDQQSIQRINRIVA